MPVYAYHCEVCGQDFHDEREYHDRQNATCPNCMSSGLETYTDQHNMTHYKITLTFRKGPQVIQDSFGKAAEADGELQMPLKMGGNVGIRTRGQFREHAKRLREEYYDATDGEHTVLRPFKDPDTGKIVMDKITTQTRGFDVGEIVPHEDLKVEKTVLEREAQRADDQVAGRRRVKVPEKLRQKNVYVADQVEGELAEEFARAKASSGET